MGIINETVLIKSLKNNKDSIRVQVLEDGKKLNVTNGYYLVHLNESYYKTIAFLQEEGYLDSKLNILKSEANIQGISDGIKEDNKAEITSFIIETDQNTLKSKRKLGRLVKINNKIRVYNEEYLQVFTGKLANEFQLKWVGTGDGFTLAVYYNDIKLGVTLGMRMPELYEKIKQIVI